MTFGDTNHIHAIKEIEGLWDNLLSLERFAKQYGIDDIFQDNGAKVLQQLVYLNQDVREMMAVPKMVWNGR